MPVAIDGRAWGSGGAVRLAGAKNAALPVAMATLLVEGRTVLHRVPAAATDVTAVRSILTRFGLIVDRQGDVMAIDNRGPRPAVISDAAWASTRYSGLLIGLLLRLFGRVEIGRPGGCQLGVARPLDIYLDGLAAFGAEITVHSHRTVATLTRERACKFRLRYPSVGATETLLLFAVMAPGVRVLENCAREPEVTHLCAFLCACGAQIDGIGTTRLTVHGTDKLTAPKPWTLIADRIEAATFAVLAALVERDITISPVIESHVAAVIDVLERMGVGWRYITASRRLEILGSMAQSGLTPVSAATAPYPGLPTDVQPLLSTVLLKARGCSRIVDDVFPGRFAHIRELRRLGAAVNVRGTACVIYGGRPLAATSLVCHDIRAGAACVLAALQAFGTSNLHDVHQIHRGYCGFFEKLAALGISTSTLCRSDTPTKPQATPTTLGGSRHSSVAQTTT